jgi:2,4'-dihydroxyacetophenone dioxygenase
MIAIQESGFAANELFLDDVFEDERLWMPLREGAFSRPLLFDVGQGSWVSLLKAVGAGTVERHRHSNPVTGWTLAGTWGYRERDWIARPGAFLYEPAGDIHTLYVHPEQGHMTALFHVYGPLVYLDESGNAIDYDDVFVRLDKYAAHCHRMGLGDDAVKSLIR